MRSELTEAILAARDQDDVCALPRELERRLAPDAGGGAGDDDDGIVDLHAVSMGRGWRGGKREAGGGRREAGGEK
ncbi:MAG: hypothetical protein HY873_04950 [Chloroflexi bacterium]|nr:hypothetical protein [Chloroflexota bacterium]